MATESESPDRQDPSSDRGGSGPERDVFARLIDRLATGESIDWESPELEAAGNPALVEAVRRIDQVTSCFEQPWRGKETAAPEIADRWGNLHIVERIGQGSYGEVYRAFDPYLKRDVALKLLRDVQADALSSERFIAEARRLAQVRHPNVLAIHGATSQDGRAGFWCELLPGQTLEQALHTGQVFSWEQTLSLARNLAAAVAAVHAANLVHGDIKAANVTLEAGRGAVLLDFGAGLSLEARASASLFGSQATPLAMAPELFRGASLDHATDLYAMGVLLYRLTAGCYPYEAETFEALREQVCGGEPPSFDAFRPFPRPWRRLIAALLSPRPQNRPSADQVLLAIQGLEGLPRRRARQTAVAALITLLLGISLAANLGAWVSSRAQQRAEKARLTAETMNELLVDILASPSGLEKGREVRVIDVLSQAEQALDRRPDLPLEVLDRMRLTLARTYRGLGEWAEAESRFLALLEDSEGAPRPAKLRAEALDNLSWIHARQGSHEESLQAAQQAVEEAGLAEEPSLLASTHLTLACALRRQGDLDEAQRQADLVEVVDGSRNDDVLNHARLMSVKANLATDRGHFERAFQYHGESERLFRRLYGALNERTILARNSMACDLGRMGEHERARRVLEDTLEETAEFLGQDHPTTLALWQNLGIVLGDLGEWQRSLEVQERTLEVLERINGPDYYLSLGARGSVADVLHRLGREEEAEANYRRVIDGNRLLYGPDHRQVLQWQVSLVSLYAETGQLEKAIELGSPILDRLGAGSVEDPRIEDLGLKLRTSLARARIGQGRLQEEPDDRRQTATTEAGIDPER